MRAGHRGGEGRAWPGRGNLARDGVRGILRVRQAAGWVCLHLPIARLCCFENAGRMRVARSSSSWRGNLKTSLELLRWHRYVMFAAKVRSLETTFRTRTT